MNTAFLLYIASLDATAIIQPTHLHGAAGRDVVVAWLDRDALDPQLTPLADRAHEPSDDEITEVQLAVHEALEDAGVAVRAVDVRVEDQGRWVPLPALQHITPPPRRAWELGPRSGPALVGVSGLGTTQGALTGKTVYVSQAHGFTWYDTLDRWATQRGLTNDIVEDLVNAEGIDHFLIPMLQRAGALVFPVREPDRTAAMVVVDDADAALTGTWTAGPAGFGDLPPTLLPGQSPFDDGGTQTSSDPQAVAAFVPALPGDGEYGVHLAWAQAPGNAPDARVRVHHAGGVAEFAVDQRRHGSTWVYLGRFPFRTDSARVEVLPGPSGGAVSVDAVRFGGGMGLVVRGTGSAPAAGPTSGRPRWEECSRYHAQFCGAPPSVYDASSADSSDDVGNRSRYAAWQHEDGEDAVFVSWHSNAPSPARGTSTWVYGPNEPNGDYDFTGTPGSDDLGAAVHAEIMDLIHAEWDPAWKDRGLLSAWFGEVNPAHNDEMPSTLVEVAFHDTAADAAYLVNPRFRETLARGFLRGIIRYFAERDGKSPVYPPDAPTGLLMQGTDDGAVSLRWRPAEGTVTGYRVYAGRDGFGFDRVAEVAEPEVVFDALNGAALAPGERVYAYVSAYGPGGESGPTATLGARVGCVGPAGRVLVVQGFQRLDGGLLPREDLSAFDLGSPKRFLAERVNTYAYTVQHGEAWSSAGFAFDAVEATGVGPDVLPAAALGDYALIDWALGEESTVDETFSDAEQAAVAAALDAGARVVATGAEIAWDLDAKGSASDQAFLHDRFGASYTGDDADTESLADGVIFSGAGTSGGAAGYAVEYPDVLAALGGAQVLRTYSTGGAAVVATASTVLAGFPLETVSTAADRSALAGAFADAVGVAPKSFFCEVASPDPSPSDDVAGGAEDIAPPPADVAPSAEDIGTTTDTSPAEPDVVVAPDAGPSGSGDTSSPSVGLTTSGALDTQDAGGCDASRRPAGWAWLLIALALAAHRRRPLG